MPTFPSGRIGVECPAMDDKASPAKPETNATPKPEAPKLPKEIGGPKGLEPTRYGDWEKNGRCSDF